MAIFGIVLTAVAALMLVIWVILANKKDRFSLERKLYHDEVIEKHKEADDPDDLKGE
ncbi:hypothetical protein KJS94_14790 [Flavihumibacter rivuli]|uniref:hypothetical protein n=1 Tax=Flavihumibacter rivuli TaxID=2838156 RepID=UPI001BDF2904|nr:hypothetical protein [Flavihumibacter rivuli]ULQ55915.1 hypothetical protein KJS94_14790 [Flavihumibacter rivuli]